MEDPVPEMTIPRYSFSLPVSPIYCEHVFVYVSKNKKLRAGPNDIQIVKLLGAIEEFRKIVGVSTSGGGFTSKVIGADLTVPSNTQSMCPTTLDLIFSVAFRVMQCG